MLEIVKRKSQILDEIKLELKTQFMAFVAVVYTDVTRERHVMKVIAGNEFIGPNIYGGMAVLDATKELHKWPS